MRPVVFLVLDSMRRDHLGVYDDAIGFTENLDAIAEEAVVFEDAVAQAPWTLPSHATMFTGEYPWDHEATNRDAHFGADSTTLAERFAQEGYLTAAITPNIWLTPHKGMMEGFQEVENFLNIGGGSAVQWFYRSMSRYFEKLDSRFRWPVVRALESVFEFADIDNSCRSEETIEEAIGFIEDHADDQFFLFINLMEPHEPYDPPQEYLDRHGVTDLEGVPDDNKDFFADGADFDELRKAYRASVDYTDDLVGRLEEVLSEQGLEDAVLVITADHGQALGEADVFGHQFTVGEEVVSVPLLVKHPDHEPGREDALVELRELYDLIPQYAGLTEHEEIGTEVAVGGYEFPEVFRRFISADRMDQYYRKYRFYRTQDEKVVKSVGEDGEVSYQGIDLETGEEIPVTADLRRNVDRLQDVGGSEERLREEDHDEAVRERLEELGYM